MTSEDFYKELVVNYILYDIFFYKNMFWNSIFMS